nr:DsbA family protein [Angustibacter aerolatus]
MLRLMTSLDHVPVLLLGRRSEVLARNDLLAAVLGAPMQPGTSFVRWLFLDPAARERIVNWGDFAAASVGALRYEVGRRPDDRRLAELVDEPAGRRSRRRALVGRPAGHVPHVGEQAPRAPGGRAAAVRDRVGGGSARPGAAARRLHGRAGLGDGAGAAAAAQAGLRRGPSAPTRHGHDGAAQQLSVGQVAALHPDGVVAARADGGDRVRPARAVEHGVGDPRLLDGQHPGASGAAAGSTLVTVASQSMVFSSARGARSWTTGTVRVRFTQHGLGVRKTWPRHAVVTRMNEPLQVEIWSDVVCPWCYIGKRRFESAVASTGLPVEVTWRSFQARPGRAAAGRRRRRHPPGVALRRRPRGRAGDGAARAGGRGGRGARLPPRPSAPGQHRRRPPAAAPGAGARRPGRAEGGDARRLLRAGARRERPCGAAGAGRGRRGASRRGRAGAGERPVRGRRPARPGGGRRARRERRPVLRARPAVRRERRATRRACSSRRCVRRGTLAPPHSSPRSPPPRRPPTPAAPTAADTSRSAPDG